VQRVPLSARTIKRKLLSRAMEATISRHSQSQPWRPVKIAYLIGSLGRGGAEGQLLELLRRLDRSRWQPSLVLFDGAAGDRAADLVDNVYSLDIPSSGHSKAWARGWKTAGAVARLTAYLRRANPHVLHALLPASFVLAVPAARLARVPQLVGSRRSLAECYRNERLLASVDRVATRMCDFVIGNSRAVTAELVQLDGVPAERTATIYNGVDSDRFRPGDRSFRHAHGWTDDNVVFGIVANFLPYKRHVDFIRAAGLIAAKVPQARFVMVGEDRGMLPDLRRQIAVAGLESRFVIIPGTSEPEKLYPAWDAYICTSVTEGFSNVLLEAAASGLPLVATEVGGNPEMIVPGENGCLVPVAQPEQVAEAALALAGNPDLRRRMGARSRELVKQRFSLDSMVRQHEHLYERLLAPRYAMVSANA
jgi:glycosyltransferase involved in cell wall biosynthesis